MNADWLRFIRVNLCSVLTSLIFSNRNLRMKHILVLLLLGCALSLCNLSERLHKSNTNSSSSGSSGSSGSRKGSYEHGPPTPPPTPPLAGGQQIKVESQGMTFNVPSNWKDLNDELKSFLWNSGGSGSASLHVIMAP